MNFLVQPALHVLRRQAFQHFRFWGDDIHVFTREASDRNRNLILGRDFGKALAHWLVLWGFCNSYVETSAKVNLRTIKHQDAPSTYFFCGAPTPVISHTTPQPSWQLMLVPPYSVAP